VLEQRAAEHRTGVIFGFSAYLLWGLFPLYFPLLEPASPVEILAHRVIWSLIAVVAILAVGRNLKSLIALMRDRRRALMLVAAAILIAANWGVFIYAVNSEHVLEGSLGYFITPLVSAVFGVLFFREHLRPRQLLALGLGACAVAVLTIDYGRLPWIAVTLALTFATYGLVKKIVDVGAAESLAVETLVLLAPALAYVFAIEGSGSGTFTGESAGHLALLVSLGPVTAIPLLLFSGAVTRIPLTVVGLLQYTTPTLQFLIGVTIAGEHMPTSRWIGFALVWIALMILSADALHAAQRSRAEAAAEPDLVPT
jgi:chloramphenicol-sensitive protein RarD